MGTDGSSARAAGKSESPCLSRVAAQAALESKQRAAATPLLTGWRQAAASRWSLAGARERAGMATACKSLLFAPTRLPSGVLNDMAMEPSSASMSMPTCRRGLTGV